MLTGAIVLYNNDVEKLKNAIDSFLNIQHDKHLYLIDNSETRKLETILDYGDAVTYFHVGKNVGFGAGHNIAISKASLKESKYHLILNPDVYFNNTTTIELIKFLDENVSVGLVAPKIKYPNGELQHSIRKFPKPQDFVIRRIPFFTKCFNNAYKKAHYLDVEIKEPMSVDTVSGCYQLFAMQTLLKIKGFDERYFMYLEDIDICKEVLKAGYKVYYYPQATVVHFLEKGSAKKIKLLGIHIQSIIKYFLKWEFS